MNESAANFLHHTFSSQSAENTIIILIENKLILWVQEYVIQHTAIRRKNDGILNSSPIHRDKYAHCSGDIVP